MHVKPYLWKRCKILVEPLSNVDYQTRMAARIAWNSNAMFKRVGTESDSHINRAWAEDPKNKIGEVTIRFDKARQGIVIKIPVPKEAPHEEVH